LDLLDVELAVLAQVASASDTRSEISIFHPISFGSKDIGARFQAEMANPGICLAISQFWMK
jgi:hypothetical protein